MNAARVLVAVVLLLGGCGGEDVEKARLPIIIVPGWGSEISDNYYARFEGFWKDDGFSADEIHRVKYSSRATVETIHGQLETQLRAIFAAYPEEQRFDLITHSTGQFVGLYTLMEGGHAHRARKLVAFAGVAFGWNGDVCDEHIDCGEAHKQLRPHRNPYVMAFHTRHAAKIRRLQKCSLFSPHDGLLKPYDCGRFEDGINVDVPGMNHLQAAYERKYYRIMRRACYGAE